MTESLVGEAPLIKHDLDRGSKQTHEFGPGRVAGEFVFVPRAPDAAEDDGWLMGFVTEADGASTGLEILEARHFTAPPIATVRLPHRIPPGIHGRLAAGALKAPSGYSVITPPTSSASSVAKPSHAIKGRAVDAVILSVLAGYGRIGAGCRDHAAGEESARAQGLAAEEKRAPAGYQGVVESPKAERPRRDPLFALCAMSLNPP